MTERDDAPDLGGFGKWSMPGAPHKGWTCGDIEALGGLLISTSIRTSSLRKGQFLMASGVQFSMSPDILCSGSLSLQQRLAFPPAAQISSQAQGGSDIRDKRP